MSLFISGANEYYHLRLDLLGGPTPYKVEELKKTHSLIENGNLTFGNAPSAGISFNLYDAGPSINNHEITLFQGIEQEDFTITYSCIGTFYVRQVSKDNVKHSYEGYDAMVYALSGTYKSSLDWSSGKMWHTSDVIKDIETQTGIQYMESEDYPLSAVLMSEPKGLSYRAVLGYIAGLDGYNCVIKYTETGEPLIAMSCFNKTWKHAEEITIDDDRIYEDSGFELSNEDIKKIGYVKTMTSEDNFLISGDENADFGIMTYNPYMIQDWNDDVLELYNTINMNVFALSVKFLGFWDIELGDIVPITHGGVTYNVPVMSLTQECDGGLVTSITSFLEDMTTENASSQSVESVSNQDNLKTIYSELNKIKKKVSEIDEITPENIDLWYDGSTGYDEYVYNAKTELANAITVMGITTSVTDSFSQMATNILKIETSGGGDTEGKKLIANAITTMGVATEYSDSYETMADNILLIKTAIQDVDNITTMGTPIESMVNVATDADILEYSIIIEEVDS